MLMEPVLFSIIIPVYNVEKYLDKCIGSILGQTFHNFELLLIDDGSKDASGDICDNYSKSDSRVRTFHLKNNGPSHARNFGLEQSAGQYITFVDSDDWVEPNLLETYLNHFTQDIDLVKIGYSKDFPTHSEIKSLDKDLIIEKSSELLRVTEETAYFGYIWNSCYRKSLIAQLRFDESINWCEDQLFSYNYFLRCRKAFLSSLPLYHYMQREGPSLSTKRDLSVIAKVANIDYEIKQRLNAEDDPKVAELINNYYQILLFTIIQGIYQGIETPKKRKTFRSAIVPLNRKFKRWEVKLFFSNIPFALIDSIFCFRFQLAKK